MKEKYSKPCLNIELFTLSQTIATHCGYNKNTYYGHPNFSSISSCGWVDPVGMIYWSNAKCNVAVDDDFETSEGCYNAPSGSHQIFAS